jgi:serine/threonine protein kinase
VIRTPRGIYDLLEPDSVNELTKSYNARFQGPGQEPSWVTIRVASSAAWTVLIQNEVTRLRVLQRDARQFAKHLPRVLDQFRTADGKLATVLDHLDGLSLQALRQRFPAGIPHRHVTWMLRRCLSVLGYAHSRGVLHGNLTPERILVRAQDHNVWLLDWCFAISWPNGAGQGFQRVDAVYGAPEAHRQQPPLPGSDLYSLALCMLYALGGDPAAQTLPQDTPDRLARFIRFLLTESPLQRPKDAWELYRVLEGIRDEIYGPHRFVEFVVPEPSAGRSAGDGQRA